MNHNTYHTRPVQRIYTFEYPHANELNPKLYQYIKTHSDREHAANLTIRKTKEWQTFTEDYLTISNWVKKVIPEITDNNDILHLTELWGVVYEKRESIGRHNHYPNRWSFVYYVNVPEGSAPLIICGDRGEDELRTIPTAGECILFPAWINHYVPENNCEGRCAVVGNFDFKDTLKRSKCQEKDKLELEK